MKIKSSKSDTYGYVTYVEVAGIDLSKTIECDFDIKPNFTSYKKHAGEDSRIKKIKENPNVSDHEKEQASFFYNSVYAFPLEDFNRDWHIFNAEFAKGNPYLEKMIKAKTCPIATSTEHFMKWFVKIYPFLNDEWKEENKIYMNWMDEKILNNNKRLLNAFKDNDFKTIKICMKFGGDINFTENNQSPIQFVVENKNEKLLNYLLNKKVLANNINIEKDHPFFNILEEYKLKSFKKLKFSL